MLKSSKKYTDNEWRYYQEDPVVSYLSSCPFGELLGWIIFALFIIWLL